MLNLVTFPVTRTNLIDVYQLMIFEQCAAIEEALSYGFGHGHKGDVNNYKFTMPENCPKQGNG